MKNLALVLLATVICLPLPSQGLHKAKGHSKSVPVSDLTVDLVGDWELVSDAADSHVNGLNLTNKGSVAFGTDGAIFTGATYQSLSHVSNSLLSTYGKNWMIAYEVTITNKIDARPQLLVGYGSANDASPYQNYDEWQTGYVKNSLHGLDEFIAFEMAGDESAISTPDSSPTTVNVRCLITASYDATSHMITMQRDDEAPITYDLGSGEQFPIASGAQFFIGNYPDWDTSDPMLRQSAAKIRHVRYWVGSNAIKSAGDIAWLANIGGGVVNGRTYDEILATAP